MRAGGLAENIGLALLRHLPPETAHRLGIWTLARQTKPKPAVQDLPIFATRLPNSGLIWPNPIGLAAGFDKDAQAICALAGRGFGAVECGTVTPHPQSGNPHPRLFRLPKQGAIINRLGFPGQGLERFVERVSALPEALPICLGANIGANAKSENRIEDYVICARALSGLVSYLAVNISSPNTVGLRDLQKPESLAQLLEQLDQALSEEQAKPPVFLKISPDIEPKEIPAIIALAKQASCVSGLIVSNTSLDRPEGLGAMGAQAGGLSGKPLLERSTEILRRVADEAAGSLDLIGVGGVHDAASAYSKIRAGAHAVQLYTALVYQGAGLLTDLKQGLAEALQRDGFDSVAQAVGADLRS